MQIIDFVIIAVVVAVLGFAVWYIRKSKKSGKKCIGCPEGCSCSARNTGCACSCCENKES